MQRILWTTLASAMVLTAVGQTTEGFEQTARHFVRRLGRSPVFLSKEFNRDQTVMNVRGADFMIGVDAKTGQVSFWADNTSDNDPWEANGQAPILRSEDEAWQTAEEWAGRAGIELPPRDVVGLKRIQEGVLHAYVLKFKDRPYGYRTLSGNLVTITVNVLSGQVVDMMRRTGFRYDPPRRAVSNAEVVTALRRRVRALYGVELDQARVVGIGYGTGDPRDAFADSGQPNLFAERRARLQYQVEGVAILEGRQSMIYAQVDAETGKVLSGGLSKGSLRSRQTAPSQAHSVPSSTPAPRRELSATHKARRTVEAEPYSSASVPVIVAMVAAMCGGLALWLRQRR